jgi:hypothetical protein
MQGGISTFSGEVVAADHVEEVSGITANGSGSTWTDVHRELWIRPPRGAERRFTFTNVDVPARMGHRVTLLTGNERPLAIVNFSTEQYVSLIRLQQFELFGAAEAFTFAALLVGAGLTGPPALVALAAGTTVYGLFKGFMRKERYRQAEALVETEIRRIISDPGEAPDDDLSRLGTA